MSDDTREPYTSPAEPVAVSTVDQAALGQGGSYADGQGYSSVPLP